MPETVTEKGTSRNINFYYRMSKIHIATRDNKSFGRISKRSCARYFALLSSKEPTFNSCISELQELTTVFALIFLPSQSGDNAFLGAFLLLDALLFRLGTLHPENFVNIFTASVFYGMVDTHPFWCQFGLSY
jgi:hypothetical protein